MGGSLGRVRFHSGEEWGGKNPALVPTCQSETPQDLKWLVLERLAPSEVKSPDRPLLVSCSISVLTRVLEYIKNKSHQHVNKS